MTTIKVLSLESDNQLFQSSSQVSSNVFQSICKLHLYFYFKIFEQFRIKGSKLSVQCDTDPYRVDIINPPLPRPIPFFLGE